jgi:hypothetical protein
MRDLQYISPTSLSKYIEDPDIFYLEYLADHRPPRFPQTQPMSIGSAFDAYAKSFLHRRLFGTGHKDSNLFDLKTIFEKQVEPHNRDWAWQHGERVFRWYQQSGALADMIVEMQGAIGEPKFEMDIQNVIQYDFQDVMLLGKPDIFLTNKEGMKVTLDWKVNGYCSKSGVSPKPGYVKLFPGLTSHKDAWPTAHKGIMVNGTTKTLKDIDESWNRQTIIYSWLCGCSVGEDFIIGIDQITARGMEGDGYPALRCAKHRYKSNQQHQYEVYYKAVECWQAAKGGQENYFKNMTKEESKLRCEMLEQRAKEANQGSGDAEFDKACETRHF